MRRRIHDGRQAFVALPDGRHLCQRTKAFGTRQFQLVRSEKYLGYVCAEGYGLAISITGRAVWLEMVYAVHAATSEIRREDKDETRQDETRQGKTTITVSGKRSDD